MSDIELLGNENFPKPYLYDEKAKWNVVYRAIQALKAASERGNTKLVAKVDASALKRRRLHSVAHSYASRAGIDINTAVRGDYLYIRLKSVAKFVPRRVSA